MKSIWNYQKDEKTRIYQTMNTLEYSQFRPRTDWVLKFIDVNKSFNKKFKALPVIFWNLLPNKHILFKGKIDLFCKKTHVSAVNQTVLLQPQQKTRRQVKFNDGERLQTFDASNSAKSNHAPNFIEYFDLRNFVLCIKAQETFRFPERSALGKQQ